MKSIKVLRKKLKLSCLEFAKKAGISVGTVYNLETKMASVSAKSIKKIEKAFGVQFDISSIKNKTTDEIIKPPEENGKPALHEKYLTKQLENSFSTRWKFLNDLPSEFQEIIEKLAKNLSLVDKLSKQSNKMENLLNMCPTSLLPNVFVAIKDRKSPPCNKKKLVN